MHYYLNFKIQIPTTQTLLKIFKWLHFKYLLLFKLLFFKHFKNNLNCQNFICQEIKKNNEPPGCSDWAFWWSCKSETWCCCCPASTFQLGESRSAGGWIPAGSRSNAARPTRSCWRRRSSKCDLSCCCSSWVSSGLPCLK